MFDSRIKAKELIADIQSEADIAIPVSNKLYASWLNSLQQLLYSEIIKEQKIYTYVPNRTSNKIQGNTYTDTEVSPGDTHKYQILGSVNNQEGASEELTVEIPDTNETITSIDYFNIKTDVGNNTDTTRVMLSWGDTAINVEGDVSYTIYKNWEKYQYAVGLTGLTFVDEITEEDYVDPNGVIYQVVMEVDGEEVAWSDEITVTVTVNPETSSNIPLGVEVRNHSVRLNWIEKQFEHFNLKKDGVTFSSFLEPVIDLTDISTSDTEDKVRFEDLYTVYADDIQLKKTNPESGEIFPNTYYKSNNNLVYNTDLYPYKVKLNYFVRPALISVNESVNESDVISDGNVMIPAEFIDLVKAKLRGEAYKFANEDNLAAKWLNDYNILLETFKAWIAEKAPHFGM